MSEPSKPMVLADRDAQGAVHVYYDDGSGEMAPYIEFDMPDGRHVREPAHDAMALHLLHQGVVFVGAMLVNGQTPTLLSVNVNDFFAPAADFESVTLGDLPVLFEAHRADPKWGKFKWSIMKRKERPWARAMERMQRSGAWTEELEAVCATPVVAEESGDVK